VLRNALLGFHGKDRIPTNLLDVKGYLPSPPVIPFLFAWIDPRRLIHHSANCGGRLNPWLVDLRDCSS
jgi:hypothetical protein